MKETIVVMEGIEKHFPGVHALSQCKFELKKGEVHALIGENGAGKSTLMKILTGVYGKDSGKIIYKGQEVEIHNPKAAQNLGICIVHQELNLMLDLTIAENIFIGREPKKSIPCFINDSIIYKKSQDLLDSMNVDLDAKMKVEDLTVAQQQMVEITKAISFNSEVLIMDEPTAALTESEIDELFRIIGELQRKGVGIIYISHRMEELKKICDRATVMRDGQYVGTKEMKEVTIEEIIQMMVGREIYESGQQEVFDESVPVILKVENLKRGRAVKDVSFHLKKGEILGFAGLMGAGRTEVARAIFGADKKDSGDVYLNGKLVNIKSPKEAVAHGIGYLSEDRKRYGLVLGLDIETNLVMSSFKKFTGFLGWVHTKDTEKNSKAYIHSLKIKTPSAKQLIKNLSGGNQQKVVIGKWLTKNCDILIFDEPTRGIDVGAKGEIYKLINNLAKEGKSIIMISSELPEVLRMSHRVVVMCEGRITGELNVQEATQERIMNFATAR